MLLISKSSAPLTGSIQVVQWWVCLTSIQKVLGSNPSWIPDFFLWIYFSLSEHHEHLLSIKLNNINCLGFLTLYVCCILAPCINHCTDSDSNSLESDLNCLESESNCTELLECPDSDSKLPKEVIRNVQKVIRNVQRVIQKCPESDSNVQKVILTVQTVIRMSRKWFELSREWFREWVRTVQTVIRIVQRVIQRMIQNCPEIFEFPESDSNCPQNYLNCPERMVFDVSKIGKRQSLKAVQKVIWSSLETLSDLQC